MNYRTIRIGQIGRDNTVAFAVEELQRYLKKIDAELCIDVLQVDTPNAEYENVLWVGLDPATFKCVPAVKEPALDDGVFICVEEGSGYITGTNPRSVLFGVYFFLRELGCYWASPGEAGEYIPQKPLTDMTVSYKHMPSYRHRGVCIEGANSYENVKEMIDFLPKHGMNAYFIQFWEPVTFFQRWYTHEGNPNLVPQPLSRREVSAITKKLEGEIAKRGLCYHKTGHGWTCEPFGVDGTSWQRITEEELPPEMRDVLAVVEGERQLCNKIPINTNLCYSQPHIRKKLVQSVVAYCKANPNVHLLHFWLADALNNHCECEACRTQRPSDWYVEILNALDEAMTAEGILTKIVFLIYTDLLWAPEKQKIRNKDRFVLMFAPITRFYGQNYDDHLEYDSPLAPYVRNKLTMPQSLAQNLAHLRVWQQNYDGDSFDFDYHLMWAHLNDWGYEACARNLWGDVKALKAIGLNGLISCQVQRCFFPTALPFITMAATLWDRACDFEETAIRYYEAVFGTAGQQVHRYLADISDNLLLYEGPREGLREKDYSPYCKNLQQLQTSIDDLELLTRQNSGAQWGVLNHHICYMRKLLQILQLRIEGNTAQAQNCMGEFLKWLADTEIPYQSILDVRNTRGHWSGRVRFLKGERNETSVTM